MLRLMSMFRLIALMAISKVCPRIILQCVINGLLTAVILHETALQAARQLLSQSPLPEAVFATDSLKLMSIYRAAAEKNIAIPQQLAVVGYSNETLSFILTPAPGRHRCSDAGVRSTKLRVIIPLNFWKTVTTEYYRCHAYDAEINTSYLA